MRILVTGSEGQLGREVMRASVPADILRIGLARRELDVTDGVAAFAAVRELAPDVIVNCAAYTAVDAAETDGDAAFRVNRDGAGNLAEAGAQSGAPIIHLSTDYVFDGEKPTPYDEADAPRPINVYGASKAAGEEAVRGGNPRHLILRTSWLYAAQGRNFVRTMLELGRSRPEIRVVDDQLGCPTAAPDLAAAILRLAAVAAAGDARWGIYHCCNAGAASWFGLATAVFELAGQTAPRVVPVPSSAFPRPARRPHRSALDCGRLAATFGIEMRAWRQALGPVLREIEAANRESVR